MKLMRKREPRGGATTVEMAFVVIVFLMLLFGIIEYCRYIFFRQLVVNATREGARYAVVNTLDTDIEKDAIARVKHYMNGMDARIGKYLCQVYLADAAGTKVGNAADAQFGQYVAVEITGEYSPILPSFLFMGSTMPMSSKTVMGSEAN